MSDPRGSCLRPGIRQPWPECEVQLRLLTGWGACFHGPAVTPLQIIPVWLCNASVPTPTSCAIGSPDLVECGFSLPGNATTTLEVPFSIQGVTLQYHTPYPFSWHIIESTTPVVFNWSDPNHNGSPATVPYPANGTLLCDSSADCGDGVTCNTQLKPPRCQTVVPSPLPPWPSPPPLPTPSAAPAAYVCNVTGNDWAQASLAATPAPPRSGHEGQAFYKFAPAPSGAVGAYTYTCSSGKGLCVGGAGGQGNGTLQLSLTSPAVTMTPWGVAPLTGIINDVRAGERGRRGRGFYSRACRTCNSLRRSPCAPIRPRSDSHVRRYLAPHGRRRARRPEQLRVAAALAPQHQRFRRDIARAAQPPRRRCLARRHGHRPPPGAPRGQSRPLCLCRCRQRRAALPRHHAAAPPQRNRGLQRHSSPPEPRHHRATRHGADRHARRQARRPRRPRARERRR